MTKKALNQNAKFVQELIETAEPDFIFSNKPINRFNVIKNNNGNFNQSKIEEL